MVRPMLSDRCLSVLSITLVYCGQMAGWIRMKLGMRVGLGPGHIVLGGEPAPPATKGQSHPAANFRPISVVPNGWIDQDATWYAGRPRPRRLCGRCGHPPQKGAELPIFGPCLLRPNGCVDQDATWYGGRPRPTRTRHCVRWGPSSPPLQGHSPQFSAMSVVAKRLDGLRCHLVLR